MHEAFRDADLAHERHHLRSVRSTTCTRLSVFDDERLAVDAEARRTPTTRLATGCSRTVTVERLLIAGASRTTIPRKSRSF